MIDRDLAELYGVSTKRLNEQVRRQRDRFPADFVFQLTAPEAAALWSQFATSNVGSGGVLYRPYAFTEHGAVMAANVLESPTAVRASIQVVRAFVRLREMLASHAELANKLVDLERRMVEHDKTFAVVFDAIRQLMEPPSGRERKEPMAIAVLACVAVALSGGGAGVTL
jgi:hypothetical protein